MCWLPASLKKIQSKMKVLCPGEHFPHCKSMGHFGSYGYGRHSFKPICPKTFCIQSPTLTIIRLMRNLIRMIWPTGLADNDVWKHGSTMTDDGIWLCELKNFLKKMLYWHWLQNWHSKNWYWVQTTTVAKSDTVLHWNDGRFANARHVPLNSRCNS